GKDPVPGFTRRRPADRREISGHLHHKNGAGHPARSVAESDRSRSDDLVDGQFCRGSMPWRGLCKILLHMGLYKMFIEMFLALPFFDKMEYPGITGISSQFVPGASGLFLHDRFDLLGFPDEILLP